MQSFIMMKYSEIFRGTCAILVFEPKQYSFLDE